MSATRRERTRNHERPHRGDQGSTPGLLVKGVVQEKCERLEA